MVTGLRCGRVGVALVGLLAGIVCGGCTAFRAHQPQQTDGSASLARSRASSEFMYCSKLANLYGRGPQEASSRLWRSRKDCSFGLRLGSRGPGDDFHMVDRTEKTVLRDLIEDVPREHFPVHFLMCLREGLGSGPCVGPWFCNLQMVRDNEVEFDFPVLFVNVKEEYADGKIFDLPVESGSSASCDVVEPRVPRGPFRTATPGLSRPPCGPADDMGVAVMEIAGEVGGVLEFGSDRSDDVRCGGLDYPMWFAVPLHGLEWGEDGTVKLFVEITVRGRKPRELVLEVHKDPNVAAYFAYASVLAQ